jgi:ABC-2 type transport system permease protein
MRAKVLTAYAMALTSLVLLYIAGASLGVGMAAGRWIAMTLLIVVGLAPFAALGIALGHLLNVDSIGPVTGGTVSILALVSGTWFPVTHGFLHDLGQCLPSYWLVQAGRVAVTGHGWSSTGWLVVVGWAVVLVAAARLAYRRDTARL